MDVICKIDLPSQMGCNHIHVTLTYPDNHTEFHQFHLTDFTSSEPTQLLEPVYVTLRQRIQSSGAKTRTQIKNLLNNSTLQF